MNGKRRLNVVMAVAVAVLALGVVGCSPNKSKYLASAQILQPGLRVEVSETTNATGQSFDIDIEKMLTSALTEAIRDKNLLQVGAAGDRLMLDCRITEYNKGNALKRGLLLGWGATTLSIECNLREGSLVVGTVHVTRSAEAGGVLTVGAWKKVFKNVAEDVAKELEANLPK